MTPGEGAAGQSAGHSQDRRSRWRRNDGDVARWAVQFRGGSSVLAIAAQERVAPSTVSAELHKIGVEIRKGQHHVDQLPLRYPDEFLGLVAQGPDRVIEVARAKVWGVGVTEKGLRQVKSFCDFVRLHAEGVGVKEIARRLGVHRSTVAKWRQGTDQPYLIRAMYDTLAMEPGEGWKVLPMHLDSGGSAPSRWIRVPGAIQSYEDVLAVLGQLCPLDATYERALRFGLSRDQVDAMRPELFAYLLGIMVGDSGQLGGAQNRYASMNLDLRLTTKHDSNLRIGEFTCLCANSLGIRIGRGKDKGPTGATRQGRQPTPAYRWISERSPFLAWIFNTGLGLSWGETTTASRLRMEWMLRTPQTFRKRFTQGTADSDGCTRRYVTDIASVPNADFFVRLLRSLGIASARVGFEKGRPLRTCMTTREASLLPLFNEFVKSYRYERLMKWGKRQQRIKAGD